MAEIHNKITQQKSLLLQRDEGDELKFSDILLFFMEIP